MLQTRGVPAVRQYLEIASGQPYSNGGDTNLNLGVLFRGFEQRGGLQTYLLGLRFKITLVFAGGGAGAVKGSDMAKILRGVKFQNSPHDLLLTGEYLRAWPWLRYQRWQHDDPASIAAGAAATKTVVLDLPFIDPYGEDHHMMVDPVQRFIDMGTQLVLTWGDINYFDAANPLTAASCNVTLGADILRTEKKFFSSPYVWKYEDKSGTPQLLTVDGGIQYLDLSKAPVRQTADVPELSAVFSSFKIDPFELFPNTTVGDLARQWEVVVRQDAQNAETSAPSNLIDPVTPNYFFLPVVNRSRQLAATMGEQPFIRGDLSIVPTLASGSDYSARWYYRAIRQSSQADLVAGAQSVGVAPAALAAPGAVVKSNPGSSAQSTRVASVARVKINAHKGPTPQQLSAARSGIK